MNRKFIVSTAIVIGVILLCLGGKLIKEYRCDAFVQQVQQLYEDANYCDTMDDCELVMTICPFGCYHLVNLYADLSKPESISQKYFSYRCPLCEQKCMAPPDIIDCVDNKCVATP